MVLLMLGDPYNINIEGRVNGTAWWASTRSGETRIGLSPRQQRLHE
jgi:hypothetical protein